MADANIPTNQVQDSYFRMLVKSCRAAAKRYENELKKLEGIELVCPYVLQSSDFQYRRTTNKGKETLCMCCYNADRFPSQETAEIHTKGGKYKVIHLKEALEQDRQLSLNQALNYIEQDAELTEKKRLREAGLLKSE